MHYASTCVPKTQCDRHCFDMQADIYNDDLPNLETFYNFSGVYSLFDASNAELLKRFSLMTCFLNRLMNSNFKNARAVFMETSNLSAHSTVKHWRPVNQQRYQPLTGKNTLFTHLCANKEKRNETRSVCSICVGQPA